MKHINSKYPFRRFLKDLNKNSDRNNLKDKNKYIREQLLPLGLLFHGSLPDKYVSSSAWLRMGRSAIKQNRLLSINEVNLTLFEVNKVKFTENNICI